MNRLPFISVKRVQMAVALQFLTIIGCSDPIEEVRSSDTTLTNDMSEESPGKSITLESLEAMFANIAAKTSWDMSDDMLWGYFFTHYEPGALEKARDELVSLGYRYVGLYRLEDAQDAPPVWWLHVEKEETHSPRSLDARNDELYRFAHRLGLDSYDGMDVGPTAQNGGQTLPMGDSEFRRVETYDEVSPFLDGDFPAPELSEEAFEAEFDSAHDVLEKYLNTVGKATQDVGETEAADFSLYRHVEIRRAINVVSGKHDPEVIHAIRKAQEDLPADYVINLDSYPAYVCILPSGNVLGYGEGPAGQEILDAYGFSR